MGTDEPPGGKPRRHWDDLKRIYRGMRPARRRQFLGLLVLMVISACAELATIGSLLPFLSLLAGGGSTAVLSRVDGLLGAVSPLAAGAILFTLFALLSGVLRLRLIRSVQDFSFGLGHEIMVEIQRRLLFQPYRFHLERNSSDLLAAIGQVEVLVFNLILPGMQGLSAAVVALFIVCGIVWFSPLAAIAAAGACALFYLAIVAIARRRLSANSGIMSRAFNQRMKIAQESLGGIRDIIIDGTADLHVRQFRSVDSRLSTARANNGFIAAAPRYLVETVGIALLAAVAVWITNRDGGAATALPLLGAIAFAAQRLLPLVQQVYSGWSSAAGHLSVLGRASDLLRLPAPERGDDDDDDVEPLPLRKSIVLDDVSFAYGGRRGRTLEAVSFTIPAGSATALIGETGSGKSTVADLLMGLLEPGSGRILVDGKALTAANRRRWQRSIAHVPQAIYLADTSIARNIALALSDDEVDLARVREAATLAQLADFIEALPDQYQTLVGERGVRLSGGQRQRLGIARAIYKDAPVLVLDEATSALDEDTELAVFAALGKLREQGKTILLIAHRQTTVARCDQVIRLSHGRVAAIGSFAEVLGRGQSG